MWWPGYVHTVFIWIEAPGANTKFWDVSRFKNSKVQYITTAADDSDNDPAHEENLDWVWDIKHSK